MENLKENFLILLNQEKKQEAVEFAMDAIQNNKMNIIEFYSNVLIPSLNQMECSLKDKNMCIWKEHVKEAIVRTIVECCYPFVIKERDKLSFTKKGTAIILCPLEEYHDLEAKMLADFFTICGYNVVFVGRNTPIEDFYNAATVINPDIITISVSNYYNLVVTKKIIKEIRNKTKDKIKIIVCGYAFLGKLEKVDMVGADYYIETFEDIKNISKEEEEI